MYGEFGYGQPSIPKKYVMIDFDDTISLNPDMWSKIWVLLSHCGFTPKVCTARSKTYDNSDIFMWFDENDVIFCEGFQKKDVLLEHGIDRSEVAFWIDDSPEAIVDKEDLGNLMGYFNS